MDAFTASGARVFGISVDSFWAHDAWRTTLDIPESLVLLSDFNRDFGEAYGLTSTTASGMKGVLRRTVFVIDRSGKITYRWDVSEGHNLPDPDEVLAAVHALAPPS